MAVVEVKRMGDVALVTIDHPPVNALSQAVRSGLSEAAKTLGADASVNAIVITGAGRCFSAGADITEFGGGPRQPALYQLIHDIEGLPKPVVAAMHGTSLGGGFEIALGCHYRIADAQAKMGLPEVKIGLIPGAGGTQRLTRAIGVTAALDMIVSGQSHRCRDGAQGRSRRSHRQGQSRRRGTRLRTRAHRLGREAPAPVGKDDSHDGRAGGRLREEARLARAPSERQGRAQCLHRRGRGGNQAALHGGHEAGA